MHCFHFDAYERRVVYGAVQIGGDPFLFTFCKNTSVSGTCVVILSVSGKEYLNHIRHRLIRQAERFLQKSFFFAGRPLTERARPPPCRNWRSGRLRDQNFLKQSRLMFLKTNYIKIKFKCYENHLVYNWE